MAAETIRAVLGGITPDVRRLVDTMMQQAYPEEKLEVICPENREVTEGYVRTAQQDLRYRLILLSESYYRFIEPTLPDTVRVWEEGGVILKYTSLKDLERKLKERWGEGMPQDLDKEVQKFYDKDLDSLDIPFSLEDYNKALDENYRYEADNKELKSVKQELELAYQEIERLSGQQIQKADYAQLELSKKEVENRAGRLQAENEKLSNEVIEISRENFRLKEELSELKSTYKAQVRQELIDAGYQGISDNIFGKLEQNLAPVPTVFSKLTVSRTYDDVHVYFAGTECSHGEAYTLLKNQILGKYKSSRGTGKDVLLLDLAPESYSKIEFGVRNDRKVKGTGYEWLNNPKQELRGYVHPTGTMFCRIFYPNNGSPYNTFWLLSLEWEKIMDRLAKSGFEVYIYFGNLGRAETQVLYKTLSAVTDSHIIVSGKASELILLANNCKMLKFNTGTRVCVVNPRNDTQTATIMTKFKSLHKNTESITLKDGG